MTTLLGAISEPQFGYYVLLRSTQLKFTKTIHRYLVLVVKRYSVGGNLQQFLQYLISNDSR